MTNPFSRLHGVRDPRFYAPRAELEGRIDRMFQVLSEQQYSQGLRLIGVRGGGKTTEILRLAHAASLRGWLPVEFTVRPSRNDSSDRLLSDMGRALSEAIERRGGRDPLNEGRRTGSWKATGKLPIIELQYENKPKGDGHVDKFEIIRETIELHLVNETPVIMLIDEADLLSPEQFEDYVVPLSHLAAKRNLPFAVVTAGSTIVYLEKMNGESTFAQVITSSVELKRLTQSGATELLIQTAALGNQTWADNDELREIVDIARGVPRWLQSAGYNAFDLTPEMGLKKALNEAAAQLKAERNSQLAIMAGTRLRREELILGIKRILEVDPMALASLHYYLNDEIGIGVDFDELVDYTTILQNAGRLEAHADGRLQWF